MATAPTLVSVEEYLHTSYRPDCHYIDGELEERIVGEYPHHRIQLLLGAWFLQNEAEWAITVVPGQRINISSSRYRVCDLVLLRSGLPREDVTVTPPLLCIEILSPEDRTNRSDLFQALDRK